MKTKEDILKEFDELNETLIGKEYTTVGRLKNKLLLNNSLAQTREETIREAIRKIEKIKIAVIKQTGAYKYNSCYEDCIDILNKLKK